MTSPPQTAILFVCLGNICRSPLAEGIFRDTLVRRGWQDDFLLDSAGTGGWHEGSAPDPRSIAVAARHGVDISLQKARKVRPDDFERFNLLLAMDRSNADDLKRIAPRAGLQRIHLFQELAIGSMRDVPDPYYGGPDGFEAVYRMLREASEGLAARLTARTSPVPSGQASSTI